MRYANQDWDVVKLGELRYRMNITSPAPEHLVGRTLLATPEGVFECSRDDTATPMALIDCSTEPFSRCVALASQQAA